jgi:tricorn protease interacting factor F2/3
VSHSGSPTIEEYALRLDVNLERASWSGVVEFAIAASPGSFALDADGLEISSVERDGEPVPWRLDASDCRLEIDTGPRAGASYRVRFSGRARPHSLIGLYRCRHGAGLALTTQCEPTGARRIFPCLDRPDRKARVRLTVIADASEEVVSNTSPESVRTGGGRSEWTFAPTPRMAPYLFYLAVGHFDHAEAQGGPVPIRVLTSPGRGAGGQFPAQAAARILAAYESYYGIPYPLAKLDLVAVSEQAFGAMENWGAVCFRDSRLLVDADAPSFVRRDVFETIAHELAHQWFGNLVTMAWWTDIWLNESFATLLETKLTEALAPEFDPMVEFLLRPWGVVGARSADSLRATHPVRVEVARPEEISQIFDEISYGKGSSVLRMLEAYLGADRFRAGVTDYLERFRYGNARTEDLWEALGRSAGTPVGPVVGPWVERPGLPVITARLEDSGLHLVQQRYTFHGAVDEEPWPIPLQLDADGSRSTLLFDTRERIVAIPSSASVHLNPEALGFYRVRYDRRLSDRLLDALPSRSPLDRWVVLNDLAAFLLSGETDWESYVAAVQRLGATTDRLVVEELVRNLRDWSLAFPKATAVQEVTRRYLAEMTERIGLDRRKDEPPDNGILRESVVFSRVRVDPAFARDLSERFVEWERLDPDLRDAVVVARARTDGKAAYEEIERAMEGAEGEGDRLRFARSLAWTGESELMDRTLELVRTGTIGSVHTVQVLAAAALNPVGRPRLGVWLERNLPLLADRFRGFGDLSSLLEKVLPWVGLGRSEEVRSYFAAHEFPEGARGLAKGLEWLELLERLRPRLGG